MTVEALLALSPPGRNSLIKLCTATGNAEIRTCGPSRQLASKVIDKHLDPDIPAEERDVRRRELAGAKLALHLGSHIRHYINYEEVNKGCT